MTVSKESDWEYEHLVDLTSGMDISLRPELLDKTQLVNAQNVWYEDGRVQSDTGYTTFFGTVRGSPRRQFQFSKTTGASENILITDDTIYTATASQWQYIHDKDAIAVIPTITSDASAGETGILVSSVTGFSDNDYIGIVLDDGTQHQTRINGTPVAPTILLDDAFTGSGVVASSGNSFVKPLVLSGSPVDQVSIAVMSAFNYMIFTNGVDTVKYYDGSTVQDIENLPSGGATTCKVVAIFNNMLLLIHTIEGGTAHPQRVRNSDVADLTQWVTGIAGFQDLLDTEDFLMAAARLGPYMILYKSQSIIRMEFIGDVVTPRIFNYDTLITDEGARSVDSVINLVTEHLFIGNSNIYRYLGGFDITPIANRVWSKLFGKDAEVDPNFGKRVHLLYIKELDEAWMLYPNSAATNFSNNIARFKLLKNAWSFRSLPIEVSGHGAFKTNSTLKWSELIGDWTVQTFKWGGATTQVGAPTTILLSDTITNQAYEYNYTNSTDNGTEISWEFETKELYNPENMFRTNFIDIRAKGGLILIEYSLNGGDSWLTWISSTITTLFEEYRYHKQVVSNRIRFRLSGTSSGFSLAWMGLKFRPESEH